MPSILPKFLRIILILSNGSVYIVTFQLIFHVLYLALDFLFFIKMLLVWAVPINLAVVLS